MHKHETFERLCHEAGRYFGGFARDFLPSKKLVGSMRFAEIKADPKEVYSLAIASLAVPLILIMLLFGVSIVLVGFDILYFCAFLITLMIPAALFYYARDYPILTANAEKANASSYIPEIISYLVISLRINPNIERAVKYAADHSRGAFEKVLKKMMYNIRTGEYGAERAMVLLGEEWAESSPEFKRSMRLVVASASERSEDRRQNTLDKAMEVLLEGLRERMNDAARALQTPVMIIFTFGVVLPLIFVALIPLASFMGIRIGPVIIALIYVVILPIVLYVVINFILSSRPATIPPVDIPESEYPRFSMFLAVALAGILIASPGFLYLFTGIKLIELGPLSITPVLLGASVVLSGYFLGTSFEVKKRRDEIAEMETEFGETVYQLGVLLSEGRSLEDAMMHIKDMGGSAKSAEIFSIAANNVRLFNMNLESAFFDSRAGSARKVFSCMIKSTLETIVAISDRGSSMLAETLFRMSDHIKNMRSVDADIKRTIGGVVSSMQLIAGVVGPMVGGMIASMSMILVGVMGPALSSDGLGPSLGIAGGIAAEPVAPEIITLIIGIYIIETVLILISFSDDLVYGGDKVIKRYHLGLYVPTATAIFIVSALISGAVMGGMAG